MAKMFAEFGVPVFDSDKEAKALMNSDKGLMHAIQELFGELAYESGSLNRNYIASIVFNDKSLLQKLNKIVHPAVREHFKNWLEKQSYPYVIQETALIFENRMADQYDKIILVTSPLETRIKRVVLRDNVSEADVCERIENQLDDTQKIPKSDFIIPNIDLEQTKRKVAEVHKELLNQPT